MWGKNSESRGAHPCRDREISHQEEDEGYGLGTQMSVNGENDDERIKKRLEVL